MKFFLFILAVSFSLDSFSQGITFQKLGFEEAKALAIKNQKNFFIDVYIDGCAPCKYLSEKVFVQNDLGIFMNDHFISIQLNASLAENRAFKTKFEIDSYPTLLYFNSKGELIRKIEGSNEATILMKIAKDVVFPEQSVLFNMNKEYKEGKRDKAFMRLYTETLKENDSNVVDVSREYITLFGVNLEDKTDLQLLMYAEFLDDNEYITMIFDRINYFYSKEPVLIKRLVKQLIDRSINLAVAKKDYSIVEKFIPKLLPVYCVVLDPTFTSERLSKLMKTKFEDRMFWGNKKAVPRPEAHFQG